MATIQFKALGKNDPVNLNVRFFHNKINCYAKSNIFINSINWSNKTSKVKGLSVEEKKVFEDRINAMSKFIIEAFNKDFSVGEKIDTPWLVKKLNEFYSKPEGENDYRFYFVPFLAKYIEESEERINPNTGTKIAKRTIDNYNTTLKTLKEFEIKKGNKLYTKNINLYFHKEFTSFLVNDKNITSGTTIEKYISQIKGFVKEAKIQGYETSIDIESKKFTFRREETLDTYLNEDEINKIFNLDLNSRASYDNVRDLFIVGVWTGLRISDLKRINEFEISNGKIKIVATEKNGKPVEIPIHSQLSSILEKRNSVMPEISEQKFNLYIKEICKLAGIDNSTLGSIKDPSTNRKVKDYYPKYKLISSHTCRRSFITNHYGKIDDITLMSISTHKSVAQFLKYVKTTGEEKADKLGEFWKEKERLKNLKLESPLMVVS
jgi:integrase